MEGEAELTIDGEPHCVLREDEAFQVPPNTARGVKKIANKDAKVCSTLVVEKGKTARNSCLILSSVPKGITSRPMGRLIGYSSSNR